MKEGENLALRQLLVSLMTDSLEESLKPLEYCFEVESAVQGVARVFMKVIDELIMGATSLNKEKIVEIEKEYKEKLKHLSKKLRKAKRMIEKMKRLSELKVEGTMIEIEKNAILEALKRNNNHRGKAIKELGMDDRTFYRKLRKYNIPYKYKMVPSSLSHLIRHCHIQYKRKGK